MRTLTFRFSSLQKPSTQSFNSPELSGGRLPDIRLPKVNGFEVAREIREHSPLTKIKFFSENRSVDMAEDALRMGEN
jgi:DNA-binding NtrC family response regulator